MDNYYEIFNAVRQHKKLNASDKVVGWSILNFMSMYGKNTIYLNRKTVAEDTNLSVRQICRCFKKLEINGFFKIKRQGTEENTLSNIITLIYEIHKDEVTPLANSAIPQDNLSHPQDNLSHPQDNLSHPQDNLSPYIESIQDIKKESMKESIHYMNENSYKLAHAREEEKKIDDNRSLVSYDSSCKSIFINKDFFKIENISLRDRLSSILSDEYTLFTRFMNSDYHKKQLTKSINSKLKDVYDNFNLEDYKDYININ